MKISEKARGAIYLGTLCSVAYFAVYVARNVLGAVTPKMTADSFTLDYIGVISALYLLAYAIGQLINGVIGDIIKAKYMICLGLLSAGVANVVFVWLAPGYPNLAPIAYTWTGFSLSMIYGPMTKVVADSTELKYAIRCSLGYTFASFLGSPLAGVLAAFISWQATFNVSSITLIIMAVAVFLFFGIFEKHGIVKYSTPKNKSERQKVDFKLLLSRSIVKFSIISMVTGIVRTSFIGYLSTYFYEHLGYSEDEAASVFSIATFIICFTAFIAVYLYEHMNSDMHLCPLIFFGVAAVGFTALCFITNPIVNVIVMIITIMASNASATILWSVYCPSMSDTGLVSGITGFLDFLSYAAAALASLLIPKIVTAIGWGNMNLVLAGLMVLGVGICLPYLIKKKSIKKDI